MSRQFNRKLRMYCAAGSASATMLAAAAVSHGQVFQGVYAHDVGGNDPGSIDPVDANGASFFDTGDDAVDSNHQLGTDGNTHSGAHLYLTTKFSGYQGNYLYTGSQNTGALANLPLGTVIGPNNTPAGTAYENNEQGTDNDIAYTDSTTGTTFTPQMNSGSTPTEFQVGITGYYGFSIQPSGSSTVDYGYAAITFDGNGDVYGNYAYDTAGGPITVTAFPTSEWNAANSSGDFTDPTNWVTGVPGGAGFEANFGSFNTGSGDILVNVASPTTLGAIYFNNKFSIYTLSGTGSLTMNSSTGSAIIGDQMGTHTISVPVTFATTGALNVSPGNSSIPNSLTLTQPVTFLQGGVINVGTYGSLNISAPLTVASGTSLTVIEQAFIGTTTATINFAAVNVSSAANIAFSYSYNGGSGVFYASSLSLGANATAEVEAPASSTNGKALLQVGGLSLSPTSKLDLQINDLIVQGNTSLSTVTSAIASGYNNGNWNGSSGITSSTAAADSNHLTALGVIENTVDGTDPIYGPNGQGTFASFDGVEPNPTDILVRYTYYGDANLDGQVDASDYSLIDNGYLNNLTGWYNGDFNYDGVVNGSDYTLIDNAFNMQGTNLLNTPSAPSAQIATEFAGTASAVPEPASLSLLALGAVGLLRRKKL